MKKTLLFCLMLLSTFSCIKLEENSKKYSARKLQKMLEGTWEIQDYEVDGISYLDTFLKVNTNWNCKKYTFKQWKNTSTSKKSNDNETGTFYGDCQTSSNDGYVFYPKEKKLIFGGLNFRDSTYFFDSDGVFNVLKLEHNELVLSDEKEGHIRTINFLKV